MWANWEFITPFIAQGQPNPFTPLLFVSHRVPTSSVDDPRYQKGYLDLVFVAFYVVFWSFVRQAITLWLCRPVARKFGIKKEAKLDRFGEQGYAVIYFAFTGFWGLVSGDCVHSAQWSETVCSESCHGSRHGSTKPNNSGLVCVNNEGTYDHKLSSSRQITLTGI